ncbi:putative er membrane protein [Phaeomoniella chlamydospora]|uniref:Putative er membrane protein n=1 Tax=Phaeomoniella chlamydospora TaxID=158046 RepID=A0A0G2H7W8_PHACM|nr:putative er membrane protein [Phaeomoniella chlamydospora]
MGDSFLVSLWESVFTPGPTPTLLVATNASFAALQAILFLLFLATYSIHFIILSFLCAGLWWSINWFVAELQASKEQEERTKEKVDDAEDEQEELGIKAGKDKDSSDTETEEATPAPEDKRSHQATSTTTTATSLKPEDAAEGARKRRSVAGMSESEGSVSTDSEWEKVEQ